jgi:hypothetical protein
VCVDAGAGASVSVDACGCRCVCVDASVGVGDCGCRCVGVDASASVGVGACGCGCGYKCIYVLLRTAQWVWRSQTSRRPALKYVHGVCASERPCLQITGAMMTTVFCCLSFLCAQVCPHLKMGKTAVRKSA